MIYLHNLFLD